MYKVVFLDLDQTILDFNQAERYALEKMLKENGVALDDVMYAYYHELDMSYWQLFEKGKITKERLLEERFEVFFKKYNIKADTKQANTNYLWYLADQVFFMEGAVSFVKKLSTLADIYIVTNGVTKTQKKRLQNSGLLPYFKKVYISEEYGVSKPDKRYYDLIIKENNLNKEEIIILGDSPTSDIQGGVNAGIKTCIIGRPCDFADYHINHLDEFFEEVLCKA